MDTETIEVPDVMPEYYFLPEKNCYYVKNADSEWMPLKYADIVTRLQKLGFSNRIPRGAPPGTVSEVKEMTTRIQDHQSVFAVVELGWEPAGVRIVEGEKLLVTKGCTLLRAAQGKFEVIEQLLVNMLGKEQLQYFYGWLHTAIAGLYKDERRLYGQALVFCGPADCGKSLVQNRIITPLLGGRSGRPISWLSNASQFNSHLFKAVHLAMEDDNYETDHRSRQAFASSVKRITANVEQTYHRKNLPEHTMKPYWRLSISLNDEENNLAVLPELDPSLEDKLIVFKCERNEMPLPARGPGRTLDVAIEEELPALLHYLRHEHKITPELASKRYGIKAFVHPVIREELAQLDPAIAVYSALRLLYQGARLEKTVTEMMFDVGEHAPGSTIPYAFKSEVSLGKALTKLRHNPRYSKRISYRHTGEQRVYLLDFEDVNEKRTPGFTSLKRPSGDSQQLTPPAKFNPIANHAQV
jgi:hypothetical protein